MICSKHVYLLLLTLGQHLTRPRQSCLDKGDSNRHGGASSVLNSHLLYAAPDDDQFSMSGLITASVKRIWHAS